jgi:hypothetical protein
MAFQYNPGVQNRVGEIRANSNLAFGQALIGLLSTLGQMHERNKARTTALNMDAKSAEGAFKADLTSAGEDPQSQASVLARWNVASPDQFQTLSAKDKAARRDGVITAEKLMEFNQQRQAQQRDQASAATVAKLVGSVAGGVSGTTPDGKPAASTPKLLLGAMKGLSDTDKQALMAGGPGQNFMSQLLASSNRDDLALMREQAAADMQKDRDEAAASRNDASNDTKLTIAQQRLDEADKTRQGRAAVDSAHIEYWKSKANGTISPDKEFTYWSTRSNNPFLTADERAEADAQAKSMISQRKAGAGAGAPAAAVALPKSKGDLVKGQTYQTSRGPATWDGTQFVPQ